MQAVILAAGKSTRTYPLTITGPKPLLKVANKTLLEHNLENLLGFVSEVIIVVGYKKDMIKKYFGDDYKEIKITYAEQKQQLGTANALLVAKKQIKSRFILLMGDDIYSREDIKKCIKHRYSILTTHVKDPQNFGVVVEKNGILVDFVEKPEVFVSDKISTAFYLLDEKIFRYIEKIKKSERDELELPDAIRLLSKDEKICCVESKGWLPIAYPWDLLKADRILRKGKNIIGKNSRINGTIKNSTIGKNCKISGIVKNSIIMDNTSIEKDSVIEDSIIGEHAVFNGKIKSKDNAYSIVNGKKIKVGRLGAIIADNVRAKNADIKPGCKIWPNKRIKGEIKNDIA
ncbi:MAG: sugar phosphate nucleotidyltransferase [Candidatus Woesearchaeota archaeon]|jgi:bifunctional UDP-N-acetylglucosamine pyrophosphorylase/glucosamine-1-phosphate N-acetyltransferase|nr:sugar phosphate nucleotidyltransferase [Candidatus Woesearchaeota archaeon]MDP7622523.1 sugar phosphate nucleotidyltransferase [Candidatus Woesearchaeota archaeon]HJN56579.1 sugar phosphate nucleotidyltransferase [Candidatus Woesearchaeota archaeon]|tara:strand:- start:51671 stop:52702 length:1032 start_codon:yes stop_codon:yes gene_type:complete